MEKGLISSRRLVVALLSVFTVLALAPAAMAQAPVGGYGGTAGTTADQVAQGTPGQVAQGTAGETANQVAEGTEGGGGGAAGADNNGSVAAATESGSGVLPFTGLDLALLIGGGLVLIATGVVLSRVVARDPA